jgi:hypothetical protein
MGLYYSSITRNNVTLTIVGETNESHDVIHYSCSLDRDMNHGSPHCSAGVLATWLQLSVPKLLLVLDHYIQDEMKRKCVYSGWGQVVKVAWRYKVTGRRTITVQCK